MLLPQGLLALRSVALGTRVALHGSALVGFAALLHLALRRPGAFTRALDSGTARLRLVLDLLKALLFAVPPSIVPLRHLLDGARFAALRGLRMVGAIPLVLALRCALARTGRRVLHGLLALGVLRLPGLLGGLLRLLLALFVSRFLALFLAQPAVVLVIGPILLACER